MFCSVRHVRSVLCSTCSVRNPSVIPRQGTTGDKKVFVSYLGMDGHTVKNVLF